MGLIGGSLALALKEKNYCKEIVGCSRNEKHLQRAVELGVIDSYTLDAKEAVKNAEMVLLAVPLRAISSILNLISEHLDKDTIITDAGSAKGSVIQAAVESLNDDNLKNFVAGHPIAGREKSSVEAAIYDLYIDHKVILTPLEFTNSQAVNKVKDMWLATGAKVETLPVQQHDDVLAATSHLPHILAYSLVNTLSKSEYGDAVFDYAAGGFKSFSRIASSDPIMWRDICLENKTALLTSLNNYQQDLADLAELISDGDEQALEKLFEHAKQTRDRNIND